MAPKSHISGLRYFSGMVLHFPKTHAKEVYLNLDIISIVVNNLETSHFFLENYNKQYQTKSDNLHICSIKSYDEIVQYLTP